MAPTKDATEAATATLSVHDVAVMRDAQLAQFMKNHRLPNGGYELPIDGWDKLSREDRARLAERLQALERSLAQSPTACSRPLDLDDLNARLRQIPSDTSASLRAHSLTIARSERSRSPFDPEADRRRWETLPYQDLVSDGGRPVYPIDLLEDVLSDPNRFEDILRTWQESLNEISPDGVFLKQLQRWQDFRKWQNDNRGLEDDNGGFPAYVERQKKYVREEVLEEPGAKQLAEIEADPLCLKPSWDQDQLLRRRQRRLFREHGCHGFDEYAAAVERRLTRHDFVRPFELDEDPRKQDKLNTWIEYLNFEYWWLDKYISDMERLQPDHDRAWQALVALNILRPHETKDYVRSDAAGREAQADVDQAREAVLRAEAHAKEIYRLTQEDPNRLDIPKARRMSMMKEGTAKLLAARDRLQRIQQRNARILSFVQGTFDYTREKKSAALHRVRVQWVLGQVPLVEAEMAESSAAGARTAKRRRSTDHDDEESLGNQGLKKRKVDHHESAPNQSDKPAPHLVKTQDDGESSRTLSATAERPHPSEASQTMSQGPRRSARIAARQAASRPAPPSTSRPKSSQPSRPRRSADGTKSSPKTEGGVPSRGRAGVTKLVAAQRSGRKRSG